MAISNHLYQFEGDPAQQPYPSFTYRYRREVLTRKVCPKYARVIFEKGDLSDYLNWIALREQAIKTNQMILSEYGIDGAGGRVGGGFWFSVVPIAGAQLIETIWLDEETEVDITTIPIYGGDLSLVLNIYMDGTLEKSITVIDEKPFRTGLSNRSSDWQFELVGNVERVKRLDVATSMDELKKTGSDDDVETLKGILST
jgi:hypothetical protein